MHGALRAQYEEMYATRQDFLKRHCDLEADRASLCELYDAVKMLAARTVELEPGS